MVLFRGCWSRAFFFVRRCRLLICRMKHIDFWHSDFKETTRFCIAADWVDSHQFKKTILNNNVHTHFGEMLWKLNIDSVVLKVDSFDLLFQETLTSIRLFKLRKNISMSFSSESNGSQEIKLCVLGFLY